MSVSIAVALNVSPTRPDSNAPSAVSTAPRSIAEARRSAVHIASAAGADLGEQRREARRDVGVGVLRLFADDCAADVD